MITISNLTKKYGDKLALDNVSFDVKQGEILGFLGPNGAGKSTTMNIITGYISYTDGAVTVDGYDILENPIEVKKHIGYLPEIPPLYVDMTVTAYLEFVYDLKKIKSGNKTGHIQEIINLVKIDDVKNRKIGNLSKGYRQRVGLAGALIGNPDVLILDEPTVGLDPKQIIEIRNVIKNLGKKKTIILSSHILSEISAVCDRVIIISQGKLVAEDTPANLSKKLGSSKRMMFTVSGDKEKAEEILTSFNKISNVICTSTDGDTHTFEFDTELDSNDRKQLFFAFAENEIPILEQKDTEVSLEDIFLKLTDDIKEDKNESDI
ncbi:MAG: ATP-binding cassette domain-containing protein [Clostridia bacterium]|nr:ATP-binding cassette domain-containing protein [Clostridia bacterium]MCI9086262.1 ATP-binding cassette domain-containing protein [Clostridia bacterium]NDO19294.1 ATP-binding cassette domain-containing protein [Lachnospiraceae bacterium MD329]